MSIFPEKTIAVNACRATVMEYGADRARTNKQRDIQSRLNTLPTPAAIQTGLYVTINYSVYYRFYGQVLEMKRTMMMITYFS